MKNQKWHTVDFESSELWSNRSATKPVYNSELENSSDCHFWLMHSVNRAGEYSRNYKPTWQCVTTKAKETRDIFEKVSGWQQSDATNTADTCFLRDIALRDMFHGLGLGQSCFCSRRPWTWQWAGGHDLITLSSSVYSCRKLCSHRSVWRMHQSSAIRTFCSQCEVFFVCFQNKIYTFIIIVHWCLNLEVRLVTKPPPKSSHSA
jgi:hypothetical protein